ncbi:phage baseplate assembly protein V [Prochlorococcus sp. ALOHA_ZT_50]|jgi:phage baseplate assembly protein gpV|uniref:phage baseplate assembly protein V n=1 Tax=Prochlorococcus sp. ALOHA_ZT_50 TaxID=2919303 RepID=UPI00257C12E2|nr:phage baseplate assembly protein V [Prochlorococcus sp. ALOHA_ZT_50]MCH2079660.1 phage baseplate assembly protein V [Prochlorococcus sp. ALOHA_ZT_50]NQY27824.1 phage baseplate assembly protein V [Piscirickettsiaceae bacterium]
MQFNGEPDDNPVLEAIANLNQLNSKLNWVVHTGKVSAVDLETSTAKVLLAPGVETPFIKWMTVRFSTGKLNYNISVDDSVLVLCPSGSPAQGYILPIIANGMPDDDQTTNFSFGDNGSIQVNNERININAGDNVNLNLNGHNLNIQFRDDRLTVTGFGHKLEMDNDDIRLQHSNGSFVRANTDTVKMQKGVNEVEANSLGCKMSAVGGTSVVDATVTGVAITAPVFTWNGAVVAVLP